MNESASERPWFGLEQEYLLFQRGPNGFWPLGWPDQKTPEPGSQFYTSVGSQTTFGRPIIEAHLRACLYAGLKISGTNAEVVPGQWEFQVGPAEMMEAGDHLWMARYIMKRVTEAFDCDVSFEPKPIKIDWNGSGCHMNYSTVSTRGKGGMKVIHEHLKKLETSHLEHLKVYGEGNHLRLLGKYETSSMDKFTFGVGHRGASCRIPNMAVENDGGYYEDRRPSSNIDPYLATAIITDTTVLNGKHRSEILNAYETFKKERDIMSGGGGH